MEKGIQVLMGRKKHGKEQDQQMDKGMEILMGRKKETWQKRDKNQNRQGGKDSSSFCVSFQPD